MNSSHQYPRLRQAFENNFSLLHELGASVSVWRHGSETLSLNNGFTDSGHSRPWTEETLVPVFSATKAPSSATFLLALHRSGGTPDLPVGELWPSFPLPKATLAQTLSHQCGLADVASPADIFDHQACVASIEKTTPAWQPPSHGYHPHTFGPIIDELMLRLTGETISTYWEREIRQPSGIDLFLNLPETEFHRVATLYPAKLDKSDIEKPTPFYKQYLKPGTPIFNAFHSLPGLGSIRSMNTPKAWTCASPALGGIASGRGLAAFYQLCLGESGNGLIPEQVRQWLQTPVIDGDDFTLLTPTAFSCGCMLDPKSPNSKRPLRNLYGGNGFGHSGAGGSHAFALPSSGISFAYTMNQMDLNVLPGPKTRHLIEALLADIAEHPSASYKN